MGAARVLVVGSTMMDLISYAKVIPNAGETLVGDRFQMGFGGKGANQAVQAARFGAPVAMVNAVGDDAYGASHLANFVKEGIDTRWMRTVEVGPTRIHCALLGLETAQKALASLTK